MTTASAVARYYEQLAAGCFLAASHVVADSLTSEQRRHVERLITSLGITVVGRSRAAFVRMLGPRKTSADGVVPLSWWRSEHAG
nr:SAM-dependent methyltransferase [Lentzea tibetensis]